MDTGHETAAAMFASPCVAFIAQVRWEVGSGWRLWVSSWDEGETPSRASSSCYEHLTADELVDVLCAEQLSRCDWLRA